MTVSHRGARNQELNESTATSKQWFLEAKCPFSREKGEIQAHAREMGGHATCSPRDACHSRVCTFISFIPHEN